MHNQINYEGYTVFFYKEGGHYVLRSETGYTQRCDFGELHEAIPEFVSDAIANDASKYNSEMIKVTI